MTIIKKILFAVLTLGVGAQTVAAVTEDLPVALPVTVFTKDISTARVISCAIVFPLDQVKFSEQQVTDCMKSANIDAVSYVHVIATSSATGSGPHNLYLSNRRAGAIEAYLTNRYPNLQVHAFGGGENPKFGKMARIFIVENQGKPEDITAGIQVASAGPPEIIERTTTQYVTKVEYRDALKKNLDVTLSSGPARTDFSGDVYNYAAVRISTTQRLPYTGFLTIGISHKMLQSNDVIDVNASSVNIARSWNLTKIRGQDFFYEQAFDLGQLRANGRSLEWGTSATSGLQNSDFRLSVHAAKSNHMTTLGIGCGIRM